MPSSKVQIQGGKKLQSKSKGMSPPPPSPPKPLRKWNHSWLFLKVRRLLTPLQCACEKDKLRVSMNEGELFGAAFKSAYSAAQIWQAACSCDHFSSWVPDPKTRDIVHFARHLPILTYWVREGVCGVCAYDAAWFVWGVCWSADNQEHHVACIPILLIPHQLLFIKVLPSSMFQSSL